jgi:hypothetical protein
MDLKSDNPSEGSFLKERRNPENGVENRLWGWKYGIKLNLRYSSTGRVMKKMTATRMKGPPPEVNVMSPMRKKKMD